MTPRTLYEKIWQSHLVAAPEDPGMPSVLFIDLHLVHEVTSPQAFRTLEERGLSVRYPHRTLATMDHSTPTEPGISLARLPQIDPEGARQLASLERHCEQRGIPLFALGHKSQGIVHVIGPELGLTQPGTTIVCGDSHTSTHGAFGALAFGIGTSQVTHVLATQCLLQKPSRTFEIHFRGRLRPGVTAKDLILHTISILGVGGGTGHVLEYTGEAVRALDMEGRMTLCNMSIEAGARAGLVAPDDITFDYLSGRPGAPKGKSWDRALDHWKTLRSDPGACYDRRLEIDAGAVEPMITWGTNPGMAIPIAGHIPKDSDCPPEDRAGIERARAYMGFEPGQAIAGRKVDVVFLGSCTNSRLSDLQDAARILAGRRVAPGVRMLVVPGSRAVKRQAESLGLDALFRGAGAEWREAGCSMCLAMNGDRVGPGQVAVSTSNRNFEGRQGPGSRTLLASPLTAAASAVRGTVTDAREFLQ